MREGGDDAQEGVAGLGRLGDDGDVEGREVGVGLGDDDRLDAGFGEGGKRVGDQRPSGKLNRRLRPTEPLAGATGENGPQGCSGRLHEPNSRLTRVTDLISVAEARADVLARVEGPLATEGVLLDEALGRVLAADAVAPEDVPAFDNSAMDGFAVLAADTAGAAPGSPRALRVAAESRAGAPAERPLEPGEAFRISTGGVLPEGADSVVRLEEAAERDGEIEFEVAVSPGRDIRRVGDDIRAGDTVLRPGTVLGAAELGVLSSLGVAQPSCSRRPRLTLVCTGDELLGADEPMRPGGVRNSNAHTVPGPGAAGGSGGRLGGALS